MSNAFTSDGGAPPPRRGYHHGNLREALIDAARILIAERGPQGFSLIEAARMADVSPAAPYRHFKDREALVAAVAERGFALFADKLKSALAAASDPGDALAALGRAYLAFAREEPGHYGAMFLSVRAGRPGGPVNDDSFGLLVETVRRLVASPGNPAFDPSAAALQIWSLAHGVAVLATTGRWPSATAAASPEDVMRDGSAAIIAAARKAAGS
jgi:AcrR family transcriptional regulator